MQCNQLNLRGGNDRRHMRIEATTPYSRSGATKFKGSTRKVKPTWNSYSIQNPPPGVLPMLDGNSNAVLTPSDSTSRHSYSSESVRESLQRAGALVWSPALIPAPSPAPASTAAAFTPPSESPVLWDAPTSGVPMSPLAVETALSEDNLGPEWISTLDYARSPRVEGNELAALDVVALRPASRALSASKPRIEKGRPGGAPFRPSQLFPTFAYRLLL